MVLMRVETITMIRMLISEHRKELIKYCLESDLNENDEWCLFPV